MSLYTDYFKQAELAFASYAKNLAPGDPNETELIKAGFSADQARYFASTYQVASSPDKLASSGNVLFLTTARTNP